MSERPFTRPIAAELANYYKPTAAPTFVALVQDAGVTLWRSTSTRFDHNNASQRQRHYHVSLHGKVLIFRMRRWRLAKANFLMALQREKGKGHD